MSEWKEYNGSDEQIAEINSSKEFMLKRKDGAISYVLTPPYVPDELDNETTTHYMICNPHPLAEITWTNCADKMPPDGMRVIIKSYGEYMKMTWCGELSRVASNKTEWAPYTDEKWEKLNHGRD